MSQKGTGLTDPRTLTPPTTATKTEKAPGREHKGGLGGYKASY